MKTLSPEEIDRTAQTLFESSIPPSWLARKDHPDRHIDYRVELVRDREPEGLIFAVQLKGTTRLRRLESGDLTYSELQSKHLAYYLDKVRQPVFLVLVDVVERVGYWLFLQRFAREKLSAQTWASQQTVTVHVPQANRLDDAATLEAAARDADVYMRDQLWPGEPTASVRYAQDGLAALDPRFEVKATATDRTVQYVITPKADAPVQFSLRSTDSKKVADLVQRGLPVRFEPGELEAQGSPIVQELVRRGVEVTTARQMDVNVEIRAADAAGAELARLTDLAGAFVGGTREQTAELKLPGSPWSMRIAAELDELGGLMMQMSPRFNLDAWDRKPLHRLPYFDQLAPLVLSARRAASGTIAFRSRGIVLLEHQLPRQFFDELVGIEGYVGLLSYAQSIAKRLGSDPLVDLDQIEEGAMWLNALFAILEGRPFRLQAQALALRLRYAAPASDFVPGTVAPATFAIEEYAVPFLSGTVLLMSASFEFEAAVIVARERLPRTDLTQVAVTGAPGSRATITAASVASPPGAA